VTGKNLGLNFNSGDILTFAAVPFFGIGNNYAKVLRKDNSSMEIASFRFLIGLILLPLGLIINGANLYSNSGQHWAIAAGVCFWLGIVFFYSAVQHGTPTVALIFQMSSSILIVAIGGYLFFDELITLYDAVGIIAILFALVFFTRAS